MGLISSFFKAISKICKSIGGFIGEQWRDYQAKKEREQRERAHLRRIAREGKAFGYGLERGQDLARRDIYREKKAREEWKRHNPLSFLLGNETKKRKKRKRA